MYKIKVAPNIHLLQRTSFYFVAPATFNSAVNLLRSISHLHRICYPSSSSSSSSYIPSDMLGVSIFLAPLFPDEGCFLHRSLPRPRSRSRLCISLIRHGLGSLTPFFNICHLFCRPVSVPSVVHHASQRDCAVSRHSNLPLLSSCS